jgi:hypothetical protein
MHHLEEDEAHTGQGNDVQAEGASRRTSVKPGIAVMPQYVQTNVRFNARKMALRNGPRRAGKSAMEAVARRTNAQEVSAMGDR